MRMTTTERITHELYDRHFLRECGIDSETPAEYPLWTVLDEGPNTSKLPNPLVGLVYALIGYAVILIPTAALVLALYFIGRH